MDHNSKSARKYPFNFHDAGIEIGGTLTFIPTGLDVKVVSNKKIEYEGHQYSLYGFAKKFMPDEKRTESDSYKASMLFTYNGRSIESIWKDYIKRNPNMEGRKKHFTFSMVGIEIGETVSFIPTNIDVKVASERKIKYEGQTYSLTSFVRKFMPEDKRYASNAYKGTRFFTYKGRVLADMRDELQI